MRETPSADDGPTVTVAVACVDRGDVARSAVGRGNIDPQSLALTDGESVHAGVVGELLAGLSVDDRPGRTPILAPRKARVSPVGMKQMS